MNGNKSSVYIFFHILRKKIKLEEEIAHYIYKLSRTILIYIFFLRIYRRIVK